MAENGASFFAGDLIVPRKPPLFFGVCFYSYIFYYTFLEDEIQVSIHQSHIVGKISSCPPYRFSNQVQLNVILVLVLAKIMELENHYFIKWLPTSSTIF